MPRSANAPTCQKSDPVGLRTRLHCSRTCRWSIEVDLQARLASYSLPRLYGGEETMRSTQASGSAASNSRQSPRHDLVERKVHGKARSAGEILVKAVQRARFLDRLPFSSPLTQGKVP